MLYVTLTQCGRDGARSKHFDVGKHLRYRKKNSPNKLANNAAFSVPVKPSRERMSLPDSVQAGTGRRVVRSKCNCVVQILKVQT